MYAISSRIADPIMPALPDEHWQIRSFHSDTPRRELARIGRPFAEVGIHQSSPARVQPKLTVSHPGDSAEKEADRVADSVMQISAAQPAIDRSEDPAVQRACNKCAEEEKKPTPAAETKEDDEPEQAMNGHVANRKVDEEDEKLQTKSRSGRVPRVTRELDAQIRSLHGGGAPLAEETREFFEPRLGADLSGVRVQTGSQAASVARQLEARAFTIGNNITFGAGQYQPSSSEGKRLLAHELTHVIQQGGVGAGAGTTSERE